MRIRDRASEHVIAAVRSTAAFLEARTARQLISTHPALAGAVMSRLAQRVRDVMAQRTLLSLPNPFQRLCVLLLQLPQKASTSPVPAQARTEVDQAPTHQELAIMINASRETVTRSFQLLFVNGIVERDGNALRLLRPDVLQEIAEGRRDPPKA